MALEQLVNGMTGQQLANTIKNNFDKVLDVESAENKAENAGKALKTDYDATRYVEMELADGTPIRMRWDVFCQAIASVVAEQMGVLSLSGIISINPGEEVKILPSHAFGLIVLNNTNTGKTSIIASNSQYILETSILYNDIDLSADLTAPSKLCINRKITNGEVYLKNNTSSVCHLLARCVTA